MPRSPSQLGAPGVTASRRALLAAAAVLIVAAVALGDSFRGSHGHRSRSGAAGTAQLVGTTQSPTTVPAAADAVARAEQEFGLDLLRHVGADDDANTSVSPISLALALSMLENGANGRTRSEIAATLGAGDLGLTEQNAGWHALSAELAEAAKAGGIRLSSADSAWVQKGSTIRPPFLDALRTYYGSGVWTTDFARNMPAALKAIDAWTSRNTNGKITKLFDGLDPSTLLVLADAVYFKAAWTTPFDPADTADGRFTVLPGRDVTTKFLNGALDVGSAISDDYRAVQLPYADGRFAALAVMPTSSSLTGFVGALTVDRLASIVGSLTTGQVQVSLPRFTTRTTSQLDKPLATMGMPTAFTGDADFSAMTPAAVSVSQVVQRVYLKVAEKGTEAAAASGVAIGSSAQIPPSRSVIFDHPFLFLIRDTRTGTILFASRIADPSAG